MEKRNLYGGTILGLALAGAIYLFASDQRSCDPGSAAAPAASIPGQLSAEQIRALGVTTTPARDAGGLPAGVVPGVVSLPPEGRVAVTTPFPGTVIRVHAIQGEQVQAGQVLAVVQAAQPVQFSAELARAEAELGYLRGNAGRLTHLAAAGIIAGARADEAVAARQRAEASLRENRRLLSLAGSGRDGTVMLRAPISGRLAVAAAEVGSVTGTGEAPFVVENTASLRLDLQVPERLAGKVRPGMTVQITQDGQDSGNPGLAGQLLSIAASIDPQTRSLAAKASVPQSAGLVPGKSVMALILSPAAKGGVAVPARSVTVIDGQSCVFVRQGNRFIRRKVEVAATAGGQAILSSGVAVGEQVAVTAVSQLKSLLVEG